LHCEGANYDVLHTKLKKAVFCVWDVTPCDPVEESRLLPKHKALRPKMSQSSLLRVPLTRKRATEKKLKARQMSALYPRNGSFK
jgi:hypothetical protein